MINRSGLMPGKKKIVPGSQSSTQTGGQSSEKQSQSVMESALDSSLKGMKIDMAKNILAEGDGDKSKKTKKEKNKKKKRRDLAHLQRVNQTRSIWKNWRCSLQ